MILNRQQAAGIWYAAFNSPIDAELEIVPNNNGNLHIVVRCDSARAFNTYWTIQPSGVTTREIEPPRTDEETEPDLLLDLA